MIKNLTTQQLLLFALAAVLLFLAAFAFFLLQNPNAPLPFSALIATPTPTQAIVQSIKFSPTPIPPTRQTSYTPHAAFMTPGIYNTEPPARTEAPIITEPGSYPQPGGALPYPPAVTVTLPGNFPTTPVTPTQNRTPSTPPQATGTPPTPSPTFLPGEIAVAGRVIQNGTPVANVILNFTDDAAPRQAITGLGGHYTFRTLAPGTNFTIVFKQSQNPSLTPPGDIASMARIEGTLPIGANPISIPDLEISIFLNGIDYGLQNPVDGAAYSASAINANNPLQFLWSLYAGGGAYHIELGPNGSDVPAWTSSLIASSSYYWDGTLDNGSHITQGTYWWRVSVTRSLGNYVEVIYTQPFDLLFNP
jgi:hypothetical protein